MHNTDRPSELPSLYEAALFKKGKEVKKIITEFKEKEELCKALTQKYSPLGLTPAHAAMLNKNHPALKEILETAKENNLLKDIILSERTEFTEDGEEKISLIRDAINPENANGLKIIAEVLQNAEKNLATQILFAKQSEKYKHTIAHDCRSASKHCKKSNDRAKCQRRTRKS